MSEATTTSTTDAAGVNDVFAETFWTERLRRYATAIAHVTDAIKPLGVDEAVRVLRFVIDGLQATTGEDHHA